jgi:hypothetical protein
MYLGLERLYFGEIFQHWIVERRSGLMCFMNFETFSNIHLFIVAFNTEKIGNGSMN